MVKVKFFQKYIKNQGQGHKVKKFCTNRKVLSQGIDVLYEALSLLAKKLWSRLSVFKSRSNLKVKVTR